MGKKETFKEQKICELLNEIRTGSEKAFSQLLFTYNPLINSLINHYKSERMSEQDIEDLRQEAMLVLYNASLAYDLQQDKVGFGLYAKICISNRLISQIRAFNRRQSTDFLSAESQEVLNISAPEEPFNIISAQENLRMLNEKIEKSLSSYENKVWSSYLSGCTSAETARKLGKDEKSIDNAIFRIRRKLKKLLYK